MEVRSYYATTVEAAVELARQEMGPEAMLVHSRRSTPETAHLGRYEVVFAGESLAPDPPIPQPEPGKPDFSSFLRAAGVHPKGTGPTPAIVCSPGLGRPGVASDVVALVGAPGAGKTSVLMKLAVAHGLLASRPVRILAFDPERVGATSQLRHFAELLSIDFAEFETLEELCGSLSHRGAGLTLIDTPGYSRTDERELQELASAFRSHPEIETQLVLRADRKTTANLAAIDRFSVFEPARMIVTALDETDDLADLLTLIEHASVPVSFLSTGQPVGELETASTSRLEGFIRDGKRSASRAAA